jgi:flagellar protein FlaG
METINKIINNNINNNIQFPVEYNIGESSKSISSYAKNISDNNSQPKTLNKDELNTLLDKINNTDSVINNNLQFKLDTETDIYMVKVTDKKTDNLIVQYPSQDFVKNAKYFKEHVSLLFNLKV